MGVILSKGQKVDLTKTHSGLNHVTIGLGWETNQHGANYDMDASAFLLGASQKVQSDQDFIFYNNTNGANGSVIYIGDNRAGQGALDNKQMKVDLSRVPLTIERIAFTITIHDAFKKGQNFGQIRNAYVRVVNERNQVELIRFDLGRDYTIETAIVAAELYRHNGEWKFNAIGSGFQGGLEALCRNFGVTVEKNPTPQYRTSSALSSMHTSHHYDNHQEYANSPSTRSQTNTSSYNSMRRPNDSNQYGQASYTTDEICCPRCRSTNIRTGEKGFGLGKAAIGGLILGPVGLLGGFIGKGQLKISCNGCGYNWSPSKADYSEWGRQQKQRAKDLFIRYKNPDVLDAVVAACALVSMADGRLDSSEERKMIDFLHQSEELRVFDTNKVLEQYHQFVRKIEYDQIIGKSDCFRALGKVRSKPEIARLVARYCISIGYADGHFDQREKMVVSEICQELGLNPNEFIS